MSSSVLSGRNPRGVKRPITTDEIAYASLPSNPEVGQMANVSNSNTAVWGATAAAGGTDRVLVRYNGTVWTVVGK